MATDTAMTCSRFAPDEVGLALSLSRLTAKARLSHSAQLLQVLCAPPPGGDEDAFLPGEDEPPPC
jgi:hypothetical protein